MNTPTVVYVLLFLTSVLYAYLLQVWQEHWPESYDDLTWLSVVVGVTYTLAGLYFLLDLTAWLMVCLAFVVTGVPIIIRSLAIHARNRREANRIWEKWEE